MGFFFFSACKYEKIDVGSGEVFYSKQVNKNVAVKVGQFFIDSLKQGSHKFSIRVDKKNQKYQVSLIPDFQNAIHQLMMRQSVVIGIRDSILEDRVYRKLGAMLSKQVFNGDVLEVLICNDDFKPRRIVPFYGVTYPVIDKEIYFSKDINAALAQKVGVFLSKNPLFFEIIIFTQVIKKNDTYHLRLTLGEIMSSVYKRNYCEEELNKIKEELQQEFKEQKFSLYFSDSQGNIFCKQ